MKGGSRPSNSLERTRAPKRQPKSKIVIVCEGKVTEPRYFVEFRRHHGDALVEIEAIGPAGVPVSVVEKAIVEKGKLDKLARKSKDSFDQFFEVWAVFDRDEHPKGNVPAAFRVAEESGVKVAYSNPCFEVWALMHFECWSRPGHHHDVQGFLKEKLDGYCHKNNPIMDVSALAPRYEKAVENAARALEQRELEGTPNGDPSTTVHLLTERIRLNGKCK